MSERTLAEKMNLTARAIGLVQVANWKLGNVLSRNDFVESVSPTNLHDLKRIQEQLEAFLVDECLEILS